MQKINDYEVYTTPDKVFVYKDNALRGIYYGTTNSNIIIRQFVDAIRNADAEADSASTSPCIVRTTENKVVVHINELQPGEAAEIFFEDKS